MTRTGFLATALLALGAGCTTPAPDTGYTLVVSPPAVVQKPTCIDSAATIDPVIHDRALFRRARILVRDTGPAWELLLEPRGSGPLPSDPRTLAIAATIACTSPAE